MLHQQLEQQRLVHQRLTAAPSTTKVITCSEGYYRSGDSRTSDNRISFNNCVCFITSFGFISCFIFSNYVICISFINYIGFISFIEYPNLISFTITFSGWVLRPASWLEHVDRVRGGGYQYTECCTKPSDYSWH